MIVKYEVQGTFKETLQRHMPLYDKLKERSDEWYDANMAASPVILTCAGFGDAVLIRDTRPIAQCGLIKLDGLHAAVYWFMETPVSRKTLDEELQKDYSEKEITQALTDLEEMNYIVHLSGKYLALAVPV